jgi:two-component system, chemotaxis family, CheB/CheR fusion protein
VPTQDKLFPIVGVGASAGGLEAFSSLVSHLPESTSMAFIFIQHLDPSHSSGLEEILSRTTKIPVTQVSDGMVVQPNHIYVIPANADMIIRDGTLLLSARTLARGQHRPIDHFLRSLAEDRGDQAIGVILSGTASDGTAGAGAIKSVGGITFAQDEASAKYNSMPRNAVDSGCIDFVLSPKAIAAELTRIEKHPYVARITRPEDRLAIGSKSVLQTLFSMLRESKDVDFTHYKQTTLQRRIKRRMVLNRIEKIEDYIRFVKESPSELDELYRDVLIHVTGFFRDPGAFEALRKAVFPHLLGKPGSPPLRIWVPGCSTGEEAYSLAITLMEHIWSEANDNSGGYAIPPIQIFATDISEDALDRARAGVYLESALLDVSPARLKRFFLQLDGGYQINKAIRDMCIFARQNVVKDPPFSNLDLISCRNLLIYLGPDLQKRVIPALHYGLKPNGYLMLGGAESLGNFSDHFTLIEKKYRIYQKKQTSARLITYFTGVDHSLRRGGDQRAARPTPPVLSVDKEVERVLVNRFVPASIVVNGEMEIVQFRGKTGAYLEPASGHPTFSLSKMAREGLLVDLRTALQKSKKDNVSVRKDRVPVQANGGSRLVNLEVIPISSHDSRERYFVVVFQDAPKEHTVQQDKPGSKLSRKDSGVAQQNERLQREVRQLREQLQSLIEDHETTSEEFKTANEEVLSANEELQSTNEELETAKEELQSSNEELTTLNEELQTRNTELSMTNNDLVNLLGNVNIPVVMVTNEIRIRRFTPPAQKLLNLLSGDIGRRLGEIRTNVKLDNLEQIARETIDSATVQEVEVQDSEGQWHLLRVRPYKTWDNRIDGAVISFQDIDSLKRVVESTKAYADALIQNARESTLVLDDHLRVIIANPAFYNTFHVTPQETANRLVYELGNRQWDIPKLRELLNLITKDNARVDDFEVSHTFDHIGERTMLLNARRIEPQQGQFLIFLSIEDISALKQSEENLRRLSNYLMTVQDEERRRLARELHDATGQKLAAAKMNVDTLVKNPEHKNPQKLLSEAALYLDEAFQEVRTVSQLLHPPMLDEAGLVSAARWLADGFAKRAKIQVDFQVADGLGRLDPTVELALFRVIQEALSNVHRHSGAKKADILLTQTPETVTLEVRDNGKGIPKDVLTGSPHAQTRLGVGVLGMRERLAQLGGSLEINSSKSGTTVKATVPMRAQKFAAAED